MDNYFYGILLLILGSIFLFILLFYVWLNIKEHRKPLYMKKLKKVRFPEGFLDEVKKSYETVQNIQGMLDILSGKYSKNKLKDRISAAEDYLLHSRYKDFETTLFFYLSDGSDSYREVYDELILKEVMKRNRLPCKN